MSQYRIPTFFHQPFWRTRSTADADGLHAVEPVEVDLFGPFYLVAVGVHRLALLEDYLSPVNDVLGYEVIENFFLVDNQQCFLFLYIHDVAYQKSRCNLSSCM